MGAPAIDLFQQAELEPLRALIHEVAIGHRTKAKTEEFLNGIWLAFCRCSFRWAAQGGRKAQAGAYSFARDAELQDEDQSYDGARQLFCLEGGGSR